MGWSLGFDTSWNRDIGYGVPAYCDHPDCDAAIDRGLSYVCCGGQPYGGDRGCGLYFCPDHLGYSPRYGQICERCYPRLRNSFKPKPDHPDWIAHKLTDESWAEWRAENPGQAARLEVESHATAGAEEHGRMEKEPQ